MILVSMIDCDKPKEQIAKMINKHVVFMIHPFNRKVHMSELVTDFFESYSVIRWEIEKTNSDMVFRMNLI